MALPALPRGPTDRLGRRCRPEVRARGNRIMTNEVNFTGQSGVTWRYWTDRPLGTPGSFGGVYAAERADGTAMAVKVVAKQGRFGRLHDRLLRREIDIGRRVQDAGGDMLLPVIDAADASEALLLVMARAGDPLSKAVPMSESDTISVMTNIATGLQQLHAIGIIHRDLKPSNVLLHDGHWKLADFGIARDQEIGTQDPTFVGWGSAAYMAPELWQQKSPTVWTDLYALGCLGFELLSAAPPYTGDDREVIRAAHLTQAVPEVPCSNVILKNLISRLIGKDPGDRPQDARAVLDRLRRAEGPRTPALELLARGLGSFQAEKSTAAVEDVVAEDVAAMRRQQIAQAVADLREISSDALEELRTIEPDASSRGHLLNWRSTLLRLYPDVTVAMLCTEDVALEFVAWEGPRTERPVPGDTMLLAGCICVCNRFNPGDFNAANIVYESIDDRYAWQVYRFRADIVAAEKYSYGPYGRTHGLERANFLDSRERSYMLQPARHVWTKTVMPLTVDTALQLFQEAIDLRPPSPHTRH